MDTQSPCYWLPDHVYVCRVDEAVIFLNTQTDKYSAVAGEQMQLLGAVVQGWPAEPPAACEEHARGLAEQLVERGVLTRSAGNGKPATPAQLSCSAVSIAVGIDLLEERAIHLLDVLAFLSALLRASLSLRWRGLQKTVDTLRNRKRKHGGVTFDMQRAIELVCVFRRLRCYFVVLRGRCLLHSIVLTNFLASYGIFPTFVMGVRVRPWAAHSWVQQDQFVFDTTPARTRDFTPILAT